MKRIYIAKIVSTHGLKGGLKVVVEDENETRFLSGRRIYLDDTAISYTVSNYKSMGLSGILQLEEINSIEQAQLLRNHHLTVDETDLPSLEDNLYYVKDLIGCSIYDDQDIYRGKITDVLSYATNDVYEVDDQKKRYYIPALKQIIQKVDVDNKRIDIKPLKGLFDED